MRFWLRCALSWAIAAAALAASPADKIDEYVSAEMQAEHIPGLQQGIYDHGEIARVQVMGSPTSS